MKTAWQTTAQKDGSAPLRQKSPEKKDFSHVTENK